MGQSPPSSSYNLSGVGLPFFQGVRDFGYRHPSARIFCSSPTRIANPGDILFSVRAPIGRVNVAETTIATGRGIAIIRANNPANSRYIEYFLKSKENYWDLLEGSGSVFGNATKSDLSKLLIPWPDMDVAREAIGCILGSLDDKIELNRQMCKTLEDTAQAIFKSWFIDFDPVHAKAEGKQPKGMNPAIAALFPDSFEDTDQGSIPKGWSIRSIGEMVKVYGGGTPSTRELNYWIDGIHPFCTPKDMAALSEPILLSTERKISDYGLAKISSGQLPIGTVLLSSRAPIGYLAISRIPVSINQGIIAMVCDFRFPNIYALHWTKTNLGMIVSQANGSTFLEISKNNFRLIKAIVPTVEVLNSFMGLVEPLYLGIESLLLENELLNAMRDELLPKLISGNLRIRDAEKIVGRSV